MAVFGKIEEFNLYQDNWDEYDERLSHYFIANKIDDEDIKKSVLLSVVGGKMYSLIRNLSSPLKPGEKSFDELRTLIKNHLHPKPLIIAERFKFHQRKQREGESVNQYLAELRELSENCEFNDFLDQAIRDRFVCGLAEPSIQRKLLSEAELTLKKAIDIAVSMEMANNETVKFKNISEVEFKQQLATNKLSASSSAPECFRCGKNNHDADNRFHVKSKCHNCKKVGHLGKKCPQKRDLQQSISGTTRDGPNKGRPFYKSKKTKSKVQFVDSTNSVDENSDSEIEQWPVFTIKSNKPKDISINLDIEGIWCKMELDTGAAVSIISEKDYNELFRGKRLNPSSVMLKTYTNETVPVLEEINVMVKYGTQEAKLPLVVVKGSGTALFGRNWLSQLTLDWGKIKFTEITTGFSEVDLLLKRFPGVFDNKSGKMNGVTAKLSVKGGSNPVFYKPRAVPYALRNEVAIEIDRLVKEGIIEKVAYSDWATPIVAIKKPNRTVRICGDYKVTLNPVLNVPEYPLPTVLNVPEYPLPTADDVFQRLNGGQKFTKLDLSHAYQQVLLDEESRKYVTINTHLGLFRYLRLPYGVASAPALFQETMDKVLNGLDHVGCILDDIIITGVDDQEHLRNLEAVLQRLNDMNIKLNVLKCYFMKDEVEYFAFRVTKEGIQPSERKIEAVLQVPEPENRKELQPWLGLVNYYRKFIPNLSTIVQPLTELLGKDVPWVWTNACKEACETVKTFVTDSSVLVHYHPEKGVTLAVDASPYGVGAVISHEMEDGSDRPIAYASRTLSTSERNYSQIEKEALAIIFGIKKFHQYLYGRKFVLLTDHKPLTLILGPRKGIPVLAASRLQRWAVQLSVYHYDIKYRSTNKNGNADTLSRFPLPETEDESEGVFFMEANEVLREQVNSLPITPDKIAKASREDPVLSHIIHFTVNGWPSHSELNSECEPYFKFKDEFTIEQGCLLRGVRVVIPLKFQSTLLDLLHENHPGIIRMKSLARMHVWWLTLDTDIESKIKNCVSCQYNRSPMAKAPPNPWRWPTQPWKRIHIDYAGPFMNKMYLIVVDAHSKWLEVITMSSTNSESTINALRYLFSAYGLVEEIVSDNGPQFVSKEFQQFVKGNGIKHIRSAPYHPSSNGLAERAVRTFKTAMKTMSYESGTLNQKIARFLMSYRSTPHSLTIVSPAELFLNRRIRTRLDIMRPDIGNKITKKTTPERSSIRLFQEGDTVWVTDYRQSSEKWVGGVIVNQLGPVTYQVKVGELIWKRHVDQIRERKKTEKGKAQTTECGDMDMPLILPLPTNSSTSVPDCPVSVCDNTANQVIPAVEDNSLVLRKTEDSPAVEVRLPRRSTRGIPPKKLDL